MRACVVKCLRFREKREIASFNFCVCAWLYVVCKWLTHLLRSLNAIVEKNSQFAIIRLAFKKRPTVYTYNNYIQYVILHLIVVQLTFFRAYSTWHLLYVSKERRCNNDPHGVGFFLIERVIKISYDDFF